MKKQLLEYSYQNKLSHIPSALSMLDYVDVLFTGKFIAKEDKIVIGKPFGAQAYYLVWQKNGWLTDPTTLSVGVKHDEIDFVDYSEETMGNALGVAAGMAYTTPRMVWVNLSDASLQMGNTLEALQFVGHNKLKNILVTVDYNNAQVTGNVDEILSVTPIVSMCRDYGWRVQEVDGHDYDAIAHAYVNIDESVPNIIFFKTQKGHGVPQMVDDIKKWHYKKIDSETELKELLNE